MDIEMVVIELKNKGRLKTEIAEIKILTGGTTSKLYLLKGQDQSKWVVKFNKPQVIQAEAYFLQFYEEIPLIPKVIYVEETYKYIVYSYVDGLTNYQRGNKRELLNSIVQSLLNHYKTVGNSHEWGWADETTSSWENFLLQRVHEAGEIIGHVLENENEKLVIDIIKKSKIDEEEPYLVHGDCGVHNFLFEESSLSGVIDPTPVYGYPLYDLIYSFCSSPDDLTKETIYSAANLLKIKPQSNHRLNEEVLIGLFLRISSCIKYHPIDLPLYLEAWNNWKEIVLKEL